MDDRVIALKKYLLNGQHKKHRAALAFEDNEALARDYAAQGFSLTQRATRRFVYLLRNERPVLIPLQRIVGMRTITGVPALLTTDEMQEQSKAYTMLGGADNLIGNYEPLLKYGFLGKRRIIESTLVKAQLSAGQKELLECMLECIDAILNYCGNYAMRAVANGDAALAHTLRHAVANGASTMREALQILRILQISLFYAGHTNNCLGRLDQLLLPYYQADIANGITIEEISSLIQEFLLSLTTENDLYPKSKRAQCITLGGGMAEDSSGSEAYNPLTLLFLYAAQELELPEPALHLRVTRATPFSLYEICAQMHTQGLRYPLLANDTAILPALCAQGYTENEAQGYAFGADGSLVVPNKAHDLPCACTIALDEAVREVCIAALEKCRNFSMLLALLATEIKTRCKNSMRSFHSIRIEPAPVLSLFMDDCILAARDISEGGYYNNFGLFASGLSQAAEMLMVIRAEVFDIESLQAESVVAALQEDEQTAGAFWQLLTNAASAGMEDRIDELRAQLMQMLIESARLMGNERGGMWMPGLTDTAYAEDASTAHKEPTAVINSYIKQSMSAYVRSAPLRLVLPQTVATKEIAQYMQLFALRNGFQLCVALQDERI